MKSAIFLERDGILNLVKLERHTQMTPLHMDDLMPNRLAIKPLQEMKAAGFVLIATTNQPGISHGTLCRRELDRMHDYLKHVFSLDDILMCPHDSMDDCPCRKPQPGQLEEAAFKHQLDLERSFVVSDKWQDARMAQAVGATSILLKSPWNGNGHHDFVISDLRHLAAKVHQLSSASILAMDQV